MKQYTAEQVNEYVQWLIQFMRTEYPNNYEMVIDTNAAILRNSQHEMTFLAEDQSSAMKRP